MPKYHPDYLLKEGEVMHDHNASDISDAADNFLLLDQTTPQNVINGAPTFDAGIKIKAGQKVIYDAL